MNTPIKLSAKDEKSLGKTVTTQIDNIATNFEKMFSVKEIAENIGTSYDIINNAVKRVFPEVVKNGKKTMLSKIQVTELIEELKSHTKTTEQLTFETGSKVAKVYTELTPALKIKKAMELMQEGYEEELSILRAKNAEMQPKAEVYDRISDGTGCFSMNQTAKALKLPYGNIKLYEKLRSMEILNADNSPKQEQINSGHFKVVVKFINDKVGSKPVTLTTAKGLTYLARKLNTEIDHSIKADM